MNEQSDAELVRAFAKAVLHGDDKHKAWLLEAAEAFVEGRPLPPPRGKGTALAQSDAGPVAWQHRIKQGGWGGWHEAAPTKAEALSCIEAQQRLGLVDEYELRPLYTAPSRPDASGLVEAAEWHEEQALEWAEIALKSPKVTAQECRVRKDIHYYSARQLRSRAADRSGKRELGG